jgi:hypothetical protein
METTERPNTFHKQIQHHYTIIKSYNVPSFSHANDTIGSVSQQSSTQYLKMLPDADNPPPPPPPPHEGMLKLL